MAENAVTESIAGVGSFFSGLLAKLIIAIVIILIGLIIGRIVGRLVRKLMHELEINKILEKSTGVKASFEEVAGNFVSYFIYFVAIMITMNNFGLATPIINMIMGAVIIIIIISIILAIKDFMPNALAGFVIYRRGFIKKGSYIKVKDTEGKVEYISLVETRVKTKSGDLICIPNSVLVKSEVKKFKKAKSSRA